MRKIIYAWNYREWGGAQIHLLAIMRRAKEEFDLTVVLPNDSDAQLESFIDEIGCRKVYFEPAAELNETTGNFGKIRRHRLKVQSEYQMLKAIETCGLGESTIVHVELGPWQSLFALVWLSLRVPVFVTMHNQIGKGTFFRTLLWKIKLQLISHFQNFHAFASNRDSKEFFRTLYSPEKYEDIKITYTSVDPREVEEALARTAPKSEILSRYGIRDDRFLVTCVGQFIDRKGRWTFLEAAKSVYDRDKGVSFLWIANSKPDDKDIKTALSYGLGDAFSFVTADQIGGQHIDLFELLKMSDVFALVSITEGLPISLLEAMALGVPSISTNVNAIPEAVLDGETGLLIEPKGPKALADAIIRLKTERELAKQLSASGKEFVLSRFNDHVVAEIALKAYNSALENGS